MSDIAKILGERIRVYRKKCGYSQETLAEKAKLHSTYIGQLERGEKNATLESIEKVCKAMKISFETLLKNTIEVEENNDNRIVNEIYNLANSLEVSEQLSICKIIKEILLFKSL